MPLNDQDDFSTSVEDDAQLDGRPFVGPVEITPGRRPDFGSGSYAEDGPSEIVGAGARRRPKRPAGFRPGHYPPGVTLGAADREDVEIGSYAEFGPSEIGAIGDTLEHQYEIGAAEAADREGFEIGAAEAADREGFEIGAAEAADREGYEIGAAEAADREGYEIGAAEQQAAVIEVIRKARDNRQPAPPMRAVDVDAPLREDDWSLTDVFLGAAATTAATTGNPDPFPLTSSLLLRFGAGAEPRYVRVDTESSYKLFRTQHSPEMRELAARIDELRGRIEDHVRDPDAHAEEDLSDDIQDLTMLGAEVTQNESAKRVELWMPKRYDGLVTAWREGDFVCASLTLPGSDGEVRICTSLEPVRRCVSEIARHAAEANVPAATVVGVLPAMGCVLGAGTLLKEMAAAAPAILQRPEAAQPAPFIVRIEPKDNPATCALAALVMMCRQGNAQACDEWRRLGEASAPPLKQAMLEIVQLVKSAEMRTAAQ